MSSVSIPFPLFVAGTTAVATQVNDNNTAIVDYINTNCITKDGLKVATGNLSTSDGDPATDDEYSRRAYVVAQDTALKASNTGIGVYTVTPTTSSLVQGAATATVLATAASNVAIPINATNSTLVLTAFAEAALNGSNANATFVASIEFSWDNGTTWTTPVSTNATQLLIAPEVEAYGGISFSASVSSVPVTAQIVKARFSAKMRAAIASNATATPRLTLVVTRLVPFA